MVVEEKAPEVIAFDSQKMPDCPSPDCKQDEICWSDDEVLSDELTPDFKPKFRAEPVLDDATALQASMANDPRIANLSLPTPVEEADYSLECWVDASGKETCVKKYKSQSAANSNYSASNVVRARAYTAPN